jgi:hypothetical protein
MPQWQNASKMLNLKNKENGLNENFALKTVYYFWVFGKHFVTKACLHFLNQHKWEINYDLKFETCLSDKMLLKR